MVFRRKKILDQLFDFIGENIFFSDQWLILSVKSQKVLTDRAMQLVASMIDSIDW